MLERVALQWNDFQDNLKIAFGNLREDNDFADVTLACEDGQQVEAHKVILAASSPFFQKLLGRIKHPRPLIYMRGMKSDDLLAIVDFLYCGEANIFQENLDSFLAIAEELELKGLMGNEKMKDFEVNVKPLPSTFLAGINSNVKIPKTCLNPPKSEINNPQENGTLAIPNNFTGNLEGLEERVISLMEKSQNKMANGPNAICLADRCKVCGKEGKGSAIKDHIEANHLEGIVIPCNLWDKTFRSRNGFRQHTRQHQNKLI